MNACPSLGSKIVMRSILAGLSALALIPVVRADQATEFEIGVRSKVADPGLKSEFRDRDGKHGKVYGILSIELIKQGEKLAKPVNAMALRDNLKTELAKRGFRQNKTGEKPDILLTVQYGRSWLKNPYMGDAQLSEVPVEGNGTILNSENQVLGMGNINTMFRMSENGVEQKVQKNSIEFLCIIVTAWEYPQKPGSRPHRLWVTTMTADDPDHRDLNQLNAEMLAAGSNFFDREVKEVESVYRPVPEGRVEIGIPQTVEPNKGT